MVQEISSFDYPYFLKLFSDVIIFSPKFEFEVRTENNN